MSLDKLLANEKSIRDGQKRLLADEAVHREKMIGLGFMAVKDFPPKDNQMWQARKKKLARKRKKILDIEHRKTHKSKKKRKTMEERFAELEERVRCLEEKNTK